MEVCPFDCTAVEESKKVGLLNLGLTTPIEWMLSVAILIVSPQSVPQLSCYRMALQFLNHFY